MSYTILDIISPQLAEEVDLKPLAEKEVVEFRLVRAGRVDPFSTKKTATPQAHHLPGKDMINDKHDKKARTKLIMNIIGYNPIQEPGKALIMDPISDYIRFGPSGSIFCTEHDMNQLYFMKLMNKNKSNPNRITTKPVAFYQVDEKKEVTLKNSFFDYRTLAAVILLDASEDQILQIAAKVQRAYPAHYSFNIAEDPAKLKASLTHIAEKQPVDFIQAVKEPLSYTRIMIDEAVARKHLFFDDHAEKNAWTWKRGAFEKGKKTIVKLEAGHPNPVKALVEFLQTAEGSEHMIELKQLNEEYYSKPR